MFGGSNVRPLNRSRDPERQTKVSEDPRKTVGFVSRIRAIRRGT